MRAKAARVRACFVQEFLPMGILILLLVGLGVLVLYDVTQRRHAILHNFPIIGHFRYWLEVVGPELRQYIVTNNDEERPFSRDERRWVYTGSKLTDTYFGFGSDNEMDAVDNYVIVKHGHGAENESLDDAERDAITSIMNGGGSAAAS